MTAAEPRAPGSESAAGSMAMEAWRVFDSGGRAWREFSPQDQDRIARHFAPKVKYLALRLKTRLPRSVELSELISSGTLGLMEAFGKFDPSLGIKFDTYAESRIRGAMLDELRRMDWFPRSLRQRVRQIDEAMQRLEHQNSRTPTEAEIAASTGLSEKEVREGLEALQNQLCLSLDALVEGITPEEGSLEGEPFKETATQELVDLLAGLIDQLTPREKLVMSLYYTDELNMREAAEVMGITEGRVSQLHSQALSRLRKEFAAQHGKLHPL